MQKIKITSTTRINKPKALVNLDISYGISFITNEEGDITTIDENNSHFMKLCSTLDKLGYVLMNKAKKQENEQILKQILEDRVFIEKYHSETSHELELQINADTIITKRLKKLSHNENNNLAEYLDENISLLASINNQKKIFLGLNVFKPGDELFDELSKYLTREEIVSFVLFHEYSHSAEFTNNINYNRHETNNHFDRLYNNLLYINNDEVHKVVAELIDKNDNFQNPSIRLLNTLNLLHQEMYADVRAILLLRNKSIIKNQFNEEKITEYIKASCSLRHVEKNVVRDKLITNDVISFNHFTAPALESLDRHLKNFLQSHNHDKLLNEEDMHNLTVKCVQEGIARTLFVMEKADESLSKQINTLFSVNVNNYELSLDETNYIYARHEINDIIAPEFKENFNKNLSKLENISMNQVFDAGLDYITFENKLKEKNAVKVQPIITADALQKSFDNITEAMEKLISYNNDTIKVATRINELRDNHTKSENVNKIK